MTLAVTYCNLGGRLVGEIRGGVSTDYLSDSRGSLIGTVNSAGAVTYTAEYFPYGELASISGSNVSPWAFVGLLGYFADSAARVYVRMRNFMLSVARWSTVDLFWPMQHEYAYCGNDPVNVTDPSGLGTRSVSRKALFACSEVRLIVNKGETFLFGTHITLSETYFATIELDLSEKDLTFFEAKANAIAAVVGATAGLILSVPGLAAAIAAAFTGAGTALTIAAIIGMVITFLIAVIIFMIEFVCHHEDRGSCTSIDQWVYINYVASHLGISHALNAFYPNCCRRQTREC